MFFFNLFRFIFENIHITVPKLWNYYVGFSICHNIRYIAYKQIFENVFKTFIVRSLRVENKSYYFYAVDAYYFYHSDRKCHVTLLMLAIDIYFNDIIIHRLYLFPIKS